MSAVPYVIVIEAIGSIEDAPSPGPRLPPVRMGARSIALKAVETLIAVGHTITLASIQPAAESLVPKK